jgi:hypothetical protein
MGFPVPALCKNPNAPYYQLADDELEMILRALKARVDQLYEQQVENSAREGGPECEDDYHQVALLRRRLDPYATKWYPAPFGQPSWGLSWGQRLWGLLRRLLPQRQKRLPAVPPGGPRSAR